VLAALALATFVIHNANHVLRGEAYDLLWVCNVAPLVLAIGCALRLPGPVAVATLWLFYGTPVWLVDLATGAGIILTSVLPHLLCPVLGVLALREVGLPRHAWLRASGALVVLMIVTRLITPPTANVNLVHAIWHGWEKVFRTHAAYLAFGLSTSALTYFVGERLLRLFVKRVP
jgi:hypothetical protein